MTLESDEGTQGTLDLESAGAGTPELQDLDAQVGDSGEPLPDGDIVGGIDGLSRDELAQKYSSLLRGYTGASEEKSKLKAEVETLQGRQSQIESALQDPDTVQIILNKAKQLHGDPNGDTSAQINPEMTGEEFGLEPDFAKAIAGFMGKMGFVHRDDPRLRQAEDALGQFAQHHLDSQWTQIEKSFPGASKFQSKALEIMRASGNSISLEDALHAASQGNLAASKATAAIARETQEKARAQLPHGVPETTPPRTPSSSHGGEVPKYKKDPARAFFDSAKEKNIDLDALFGRKSW